MYLYSHSAPFPVLFSSSCNNLSVPYILALIYSRLPFSDSSGIPSCRLFPMSHDILLHPKILTSAIFTSIMPPKNPQNPDLTTSAPAPTYSIDESNWRTLRDVINSSHLKPSPGPSICNGTPADFIPHITMAHTCGLTSGISGTPTLPNMIKLPNTTAAQECQWAYYAQGL